MERARPPGLPILNGREMINLALLISFPAIALDEFLRTPVGQSASSLEHWLTESLMAIPLFTAGIWAGDRISGRFGLAIADRSAIFKRALLIALFVSVTLMPLWYERNKTDGLVHTQALVTPHSRGSVDVYWAGTAMILALVCVCLVPATFWAVNGMAIRLKRQLAGHRTARRGTRFLDLDCALKLMLAVPAGLVLAWLLHGAAESAYASQVNDTSALLSIPVHSHAFFGGHGPYLLGGQGAHVTSGGPVTAAPFAFAHQIAHAFQDGLISQAAGLPVATTALLRKASATISRSHNLMEVPGK